MTCERSHPASKHADHVDRFSAQVSVWTLPTQTAGGEVWKKETLEVKACLTSGQGSVGELNPRQRSKGSCPHLQEPRGATWSLAGGHEGRKQSVLLADTSQDMAADRWTLDDTCFYLFFFSPSSGHRIWVGRGTKRKVARKKNKGFIVICHWSFHNVVPVPQQKNISNIFILITPTMQHIILFWMI